jgi:hypothetical protein
VSVVAMTKRREKITLNFISVILAYFTLNAIKSQIEMTEPNV